MAARVWAPVVALIVLAVIVAVTCIVWTRQKNRQENVKAGRPLRGDLNQRHERALMTQLDTAHELLRLLGHDPNLDTASFISGRHAELIDEWQAQYIKLNGQIGWVKQR
jgi:hypothetical protein